MNAKQFLIVCRRAPYGDSFAREALDTAMAAAAFDQRVALLFLGDGVTQLLRAQDAAAIGQKTFEKQLGALPLYDINTIYADQAALEQRHFGADDLSLPAELLDLDAIIALIAGSDITLNF